MTTRFIKAVTLLACAVFSTLALADPPARVGRISLTQGQVSISGEAGDQAGAALVNWPVTSHNLVSTGPGARTEIRVGSSSVRLDADSSLEVTELDDDSLRLRLNYGSANVRIVSPEALAGFELVTDNARVRLQQPGRLRVDAGRVQGATAVNVFEGVALVDDRGTQLIVRAGRGAEIRDDDVRTGQAVRDSFDDWSAQRDQYEDRSLSARYVTSEMTGYEDLDQHGVWRDDPEYGPLWLPTTVAPGWAPYRDGSWAWVEPWGWTWVDNAPWGYAPFHYGRWVQVNHRWAWAPGRHASRPVWAPALVGWVGGSNWSLSFGAGGHRPAQGWYPLTPRDAYVPGYRLSQQHLQHLNRDARPDWRDGRRGRDGRDGHDEHRREGLTVVPREQFGHRGTVAVRNAPRAVVPPLALQNAPAAAPAAPPQGARRERDGRGADRFDRDAIERNRQHRPELTGVPAPLAVPGQPATPSPSPSPFTRRDGRPGFDDRAPRPQAPAQLPAAVPAPRQPAPLAVPGQPAAPSPSPFTRRDGRPGFDDRAPRPQAPAQLSAPVPAPVPAPAQLAAPAPAPALPQASLRDPRQEFEARRQHQRPMPAAVAPVVPIAPIAPIAAPAAPVVPAPPPQAVAPLQPVPEHRGRGFRSDGERRPHEGDAGPASPPRQFAPPVMVRQQAAPAPAPAPVAAPAPAPAPAAVARPGPAPAAAQPAASEPAQRNFRGDRKRGEERERER